MFDNLKARIRRMAKDWTQVSDGTTVPEPSEYDHSGDYGGMTTEQLDAEIATTEQHLDSLKALREGQGRHVHEWVKGELPGGVRIRTCKTCGAWEKV